jgi:hypothetical protein
MLCLDRVKRQRARAHEDERELAMSQRDSAIASSRRVISDWYDDGSDGGKAVELIMERW